ncbi:hypothetical protein HDU83_004020 [Entophlyctis luteolus]|nr:hypothetical protein HDU83_004020 [Entophlyctis luteolus]
MFFWTALTPLELERRAIRKAPFDIRTDKPAGTYFSAIADGRMIYYNIWKPPGKIKAQVLFFHGLGEHIQRYDHVFQRFAQAGILVKGMDWRGHGRTFFRNPGSIRGFHDSFNQVFEDMLQLYAIPVEGMTRAVPTFVAGHSMGGLLSLCFTHIHKGKIQSLRGCISQAPALGPGTPVNWILVLIVKWFGGILGKFTQPNGLQIGGLCSSESVIRAYLRDPLVHNLVSFRMGRDMFQHSEFLAKCAAQFKTPLIMYHSIKDTFTSPVASKKFYDAAGSVDKLFKGFKGEGLEHERK